MSTHNMFFFCFFFSFTGAGQGKDCFPFSRVMAVLE